MGRDFAGSLEEVRLPWNYYAAFVELHIEQGPLLEMENIAGGDRDCDRGAGGVARDAGRGRAGMRGRY